jgi:hypothetical protein
MSEPVCCAKWARMKRRADHYKDKANETTFAGRTQGSLAPLRGEVMEELVAGFCLGGATPPPLAYFTGGPSQDSI